MRMDIYKDIFKFLHDEFLSTMAFYKEFVYNTLYQDLPNIFQMNNTAFDSMLATLKSTKNLVFYNSHAFYVSILCVVILLFGFDILFRVCRYIIQRKPPIVEFSNMHVGARRPGNLSPDIFNLLKQSNNHLKSALNDLESTHVSPEWASYKLIKAFEAAVKALLLHSQSDHPNLDRMLSSHDIIALSVASGYPPIIKVSRDLSLMVNVPQNLVEPNRGGGDIVGTEVARKLYSRVDAAYEWIKEKLQTS